MNASTETLTLIGATFSLISSSFIYNHSDPFLVPDTTIMKFEEFLMPQQQDEEQKNVQKRLHLQAEVAQLQQVLKNEHKLNTFLHRALQAPFECHSQLSSSVSSQVQFLIGEIEKVEEEIMYLERKVEELKITLYGERKYRKECQVKWEQKLQRNQIWESKGHGVIQQSQSSSMEMSNKKTSDFTDDEVNENTENFIKTNRIRGLREKETYRVTPNKLSEHLIKVLISIFQKLMIAPPTHLKYEESTTASKLNISCMRSKSFVTKHLASNNSNNISPDCDIGPYKKFMQLTRSTLDMNRISLCLPAMEKLRFMIHELAAAELRFLTYKQRLAFWINIYNASIMHAFLQHGLPTSPEKLLELLNRAAFNVGGVVLNSLAIEHFILRHSSDTRYGMVDEKEALLRPTYGLGYPEPNITFALCRGSWSSPALRIYTEENVADELERAKIEFLEASIWITSRKKLVMPKLLQWHMLDFADDFESLVEWIYSQLPRSGLLKSSIMEILGACSRIQVSKMIEIKPYDAEFCYFLSDCECQ